MKIWLQRQRKWWSYVWRDFVTTWKRRRCWLFHSGAWTKDKPPWNYHASKHHHCRQCDEWFGSAY